MGKFSELSITLEDMRQKISWGSNKALTQDKEIYDINRRINNTNRAIDAVNQRLDEEIQMRFNAVNAHAQDHQRRLDALELAARLDAPWKAEHYNSGTAKEKKPIYSDWDYDDDGEITGC